jgi:hypothetical protein
MRIKEIAAVRPTWGSLRIHLLLRREGWLVNHKQPERPYRLQGLNLRLNRSRRTKALVTRRPLVAATLRDELWSMDFMHNPQSAAGPRQRERRRDVALNPAEPASRSPSSGLLAPACA